LGSVSYGEKEVNYLESIETKSHIAFFVLNDSQSSDFSSYFPSTPPSYLESTTQQKRKDGVDAELKTADNKPLAKGDKELRFLDKIVLFSKERMDKPIKTIHFDYDYSLCQNTANNVDGDYPFFDNMDDYSESGKLTLRKVWYSYEGKFTTRISPYEFDYKYDNFRDENNDLKVFGESATKYGDILNYGDQFSYESQNPNYNNEYIDAWGNINYDQQNRNSKLQKWPYQGAITGNPYDPAAWHLKKVTLPSGGEIHVQYEEKNYAYVQDRKAMTLVSLSDYDDQNHDKFTINLDDINVSTPIEKAEYLEELKKHFLEDEKKIYFKFLYDMTRDAPSIENCHSEYITGWAIVDTIILDGNNIEIELEDGQGSESWLPKTACYDYLAQNFYGKESNENNCTVFAGLSLMDNVGDIGQGSSSDDKDIVKDIYESFKDQIEMMAWGIPIYDNYCNHLKPQLSYFKLPLLGDKRGGGVRVKNLLLFDPGLEAGDARLYGHSYDYTTVNGESSGVATNEPQSIREENALVDFLPRAGQSWYNKLTKGEDKKQTEGPLGENLLPTPSIGYGKVKVNHIHVGKSSTGFTEHHFFTTKDFPFDKVYPLGPNSDLTDGHGVAHTEISKDPTEIPISLPMVFFNYSLDKARLAQGYRFIVNNMNGQPKANYVYGLNALPTPEAYLVSSEQFEYYEVGEKIPMLKTDLSIERQSPGKELDMTMEMKKVAQNNYDLNIEADVSIAVWPIIYVTIMPSFSISNSSIATHLTSKVINYPSVLKKVTNFQEGVHSSMENIAFNEHTGKPLIQKISDDMLKDGEYVYRYSSTLPASYVYTDMGQKSDGNANSNQLNAISAQYNTYDFNPIANGQFELDQVISANVTTHTNAIETNGIYLDVPAPPEIENVRRPHKSYVYKSETTNALTSQGNKINNAGIITNYQNFDFNTLSNNDPTKWIKATEVTKYSTNGLALEEKNALGIYSAAVLGYQDYVPVLSAVNSRQTNVAFESFESTSLNTEPKGHTGSRSYSLTSSNSIIPEEIWTAEMIDRGTKIKLWVHHAQFEDDGLIEYQIDGQTFGSKFIAKTGEWALHEIKIDANEISFTSGMNGTLQANEPNLLIDDIKIQPLESEMKCYVYEKETLRLLAEFDDNHFALLYQYSDAGKLVRKIIETERGIKTIQETQYNTPKKNTND